MSAFDLEVEMLEQELADGNISDKEFHRELHEIQDLQRGYAEDQAEQAYNDAMGR